MVGLQTYTRWLVQKTQKPSDRIPSQEEPMIKVVLPSMAKTTHGEDTFLVTNWTLGTRSLTSSYTGHTSTDPTAGADAAA